MTRCIGKLSFLSLLLIIILNNSCKKDIPAKTHITNNVFIVVVDGARYSETWGNMFHQYIPHRSSMLAKGVMCKNFYNKGITYTNPGHCAIATGNYEYIDASGLQKPSNPSIFQYFLKTYDRPSSEAWVIASKDKLEAIANCNNIDWKDAYTPMTDCGIAGIGTGYRKDSITYFKLNTILQIHHPRLVLTNFREPDYSGHAGDSLLYLKGIIDTDVYIDKLWEFIQTEPIYKNTTTLIVTNDHGRHTPGHSSGFVGHGDSCAGCRRIEFFAISPDFKKNYISPVPYELIDISATVAKLLNIEMPTGKGKVMEDLFIKHYLQK